MSVSDDIAVREAVMIGAFADVIRAESRIAEAQVELKAAEEKCCAIVRPAEIEIADAWNRIKAMMDETGEFEVILPGAANNYKISYSSPRESVKVVDPEAVPDGFVKLERKPMLKEIGEYLLALRAENQPLPNWGALERGERKLQWKAVKKSGAAA